MTVHKEGYSIILKAFSLLFALCFFAWWGIGGNIFIYILWTGALIFFGLIVRFFRVPKRKRLTDPQAVFAPCDGKIVVIEKVFEPECLKKDCLQISVFMSPNNVHANWYPVSGQVIYAKHHHGDYLVAWHPKSSVKNERTTVVVDTGKAQVLFRQIAGYLARRIVCYAKEGNRAEQNTPFGFIKFGSRVDVFLPLEANIKVKLEQKTVGSQTILAYL